MGRITTLDDTTEDWVGPSFNLTRPEGERVVSGTISRTASLGSPLTVGEDGRLSANVTAANPYQFDLYPAGVTRRAYKSAYRISLLDSCERQLAVIQRANHFSGSPATFDEARRLLAQVVDDGQPVPQITINPSGLVEVNWLVSGRFAGVLVGADGWEAWGETPDGRELFTVAGTSSEGGWDALRELRAFLSDLGRHSSHSA